MRIILWSSANHPYSPYLHGWAIRHTCNHTQADYVFKRNNHYWFDWPQFCAYFEEYVSERRNE